MSDWTNEIKKLQCRKYVTNASIFNSVIFFLKKFLYTGDKKGKVNSRKSLRCINKKVKQEASASFSY